MNCRMFLATPFPRLVTAAAFIAIAGLASFVPGRTLQAAEKTGATEARSLSEQLNGTWVYIGKPGDTTISPMTGLRFKTLENGKWKVVQADPKTRAVVYHHGGTYTLTGDQYAERIEYSSDPASELLSKSYKFTLKIEGDTLTQAGVDNPWTEIWKRVKQP